MKKKFIIHLVLIIIIAINILPLVIVLSSSLRSPSNMTDPLKLFIELSIESFQKAFDRMNFSTVVLNSILQTTISVTVVVLITSMLAYPLARIRTKVSTGLYFFFLAGLIIPGQMAILPIVQTMKEWGLAMNSTTPIFLFITCSIPFSSFLYTGFIRSSVPYEIEEAAIIDGAGLFARFWRIVFPLIIPATVAVIITQGVWIWNDYFYNMVFVTSTSQYTLPLAMLGFTGDSKNPAQWNILFAACMLCAAPLVIAFGFLQKYFISGLATGSVKG